MIDLQEATELFRSGGQTVRAGVLPDQEAIVLMADEFERLQEIREVHDAAQRILNPLNAILYLEDPARKPLTISSVHRRGKNGKWIIAIVATSASYHLRGAKVRGQAGSPGGPIPLTPQSIWIQTGLDEEVVADVLSYLRGSPDWIALYKAYEAMTADINAMKSVKGPVLGWPAKAQISAFSRDAQLHRHSKAWCDERGIKRTGATGFDEASALIRLMIKTWIEWRA
ncbi:MAG: hypothetical protein ACREDL_03235 [Bradyrhizobium sp.]